MLLNTNISHNNTTCNNKFKDFSQLTEKNSIVIYGSHLRVMNLSCALLLGQIIYWDSEPQFTNKHMISRGSIDKYGRVGICRHLGITRSQYYYARKHLIKRGYINDDLSLNRQAVAFITDTNTPLIYHRHFKKLELNNSDILVLSQLAYKASKSSRGECTIGYGALCHKLHMSKYIIPILRKLDARGFIEIRSNYGRNLYKVNFAKLKGFYSDLDQEFSDMVPLFKENYPIDFYNVVPLSKENNSMRSKKCTHIEYNIIKNKSCSILHKDFDKTFEITDLIEVRGSWNYERIIDYFAYKLYKLKKLDRLHRRKVIQGYFYIIWYKTIRNQFRKKEFNGMNHLLKVMISMINQEKSDFNNELFIDWMEFVERRYDNRKVQDPLKVIWDKATLAKEKRAMYNIDSKPAIITEEKYTSIVNRKVIEKCKPLSEEEQEASVGALADLLKNLKMGRL